MNTEIQIIEKPDWVSWDEIHEVLWKAHEQNRQKGIIMSYPSLSGKEISDRIGDNGIMFLAIDGNKVVGTLALIARIGKLWYDSGKYGYLCFGAVLPEYSGKGIYRLLYQRAECTAKQMGLLVLTRDTNEKNARMLRITKQEGYHFVQLKAYKDHFNIVRAKWLVECPYSLWYIKLRYSISVLKTKLRYRMDPQKGKTRRFGI